TVVINLVPVADFVSQNTCLNGVSNFVDNSTSNNDTIDSWIWSFGDGDTALSQNPFHTYLYDSSFSVTLIVNSTSGCSDTIVQKVDIYPLPVAGFSHNGLCRNELFSFTDTSSINSGSITGWHWDFTDDTSNSQNPTHFFGIDGTQEITLVVTSDFGCKDTLTQSIEILRPPIALISGEGDCKNEGTQFYDASFEGDGTIINWLWNFGDSSVIDTNQNIKHTFNTSGIFNVSLIVETDLGCKDTMAIPITVNPSPKADFTLSDNIVYVDKVIQLLDVSSGPPTSWLWNFGDSLDVDANSESISILQNPEHWWYYPGVKNVLLVVYNQFGCLDSIIKEVIVKLDPGINTVITPGQSAGGRVNTFLNVRGGSYIEFDLKVFNEWGEVIFKTTDPLQGWDGTYKGKFVPNGVYVYQYHVVRDDHQVFDGHGNVTVIR
ncbi:PKD domain-containing protein, partial [Cytophagaceae bacterium AH-315-L13]|nr:PKD domain-containing protein [Cytophagaceae bacterium AH-315-L13]